MKLLINGLTSCIKLKAAKKFRTLIKYGIIGHYAFNDFFYEVSINTFSKHCAR